MKQLSRDAYTQRGRPLDRDRRDGLVIFALIFVSCALLVFSRLDLAPVHWLRWRLIEAVAPILEVASKPVTRLRHAGHRVSTAVDAVTEIEQLRADNQRLRGWEWRARELERKLSQVSVLARTAEEVGLDFATGRVIADAKGPFANGVLVDLGLKDGVEIGFAAVSGDGLIGHVVDVGDTAARILLLTDTNSRIPVLVGPNNLRAILKGEGTGIPKLTQFAVISEPGGAAGSGSSARPTADAGLAAVHHGDDVRTSGDEGLLPRGLKIGIVQLGDDGHRVQLSAHLQGLDFISLLFFKPPVLAATSGAAATPSGGTAGQPAARARLEPTAGRRRAGPPGWPSQ